nr:MAG TPA: hypothetical protein [Crassvirales sp.]DAO83190.1 MAG TPA: hypothetical protein [Bacteriophage sp.]
MIFFIVYITSITFCKITFLVEENSHPLYSLPAVTTTGLFTNIS